MHNKNGDVSKRILYVGGLSDTTSDYQLRDLFGTYGTVSRAYVVRHKYSKEPRPSRRGFLNQEGFCSSATLRAAIPPRSSERGILADPREKSTGYGFVEMCSGEQAMSAVVALEGALFGGNCLRLYVTSYVSIHF